MANYNDLITAIDSVIKTNNRREITGQLLQNVLNTMVGSLGENYQLAGFATPTTNPHQPDQNVFYVASQAGVYTQFDNIVLGDGISFLMWKNGAWTSQTISIVTQSWIQQNYVSKEWFRKVFRVYDEDGLEIVPNDMDSVVDNIKAMVGLWTNEYLSALGMGRDGGGTTQTLAQLNDVQLGTLENGDALVYNTAIHKWENKQIQTGVDMSVVWAALAANTNEQINASHLATALSSYVTSANLSTMLNDYATKAWAGQNFITVEWFDKLFQLYNGTEAEANKITPNGALPVDQTQLNIEAMFGFWTKKYISALGQGDDGSAGSGDVTWELLASQATNGRFIHPSYLIQALAGYATQSWVTSNFATISQVNGLEFLNQVTGGNGVLKLITNKSTEYDVDLSHEHSFLELLDRPDTIAGYGVTLTADDIPMLTKSKISDFPTTWAWSAITGKPNSIAGYGILDAKIENGVITLGGNSITPLISEIYRGTVVSVGLSVPAGFSVSGTPITDSGTLAIDFASGYEGFTTDLKNKINALFSWFEVDANGNIKTKDYTENNETKHRGFYSPSFISALGMGDDGSTSYTTLAQLNDVTLTNPTANQVLKYNGTHWVNAAAPSGASALSGLTDVAISSLADKDLLQWDYATGKWKNVVLSTVMSGYATTSQLANYLPLAGGTITGTIYGNTGKGLVIQSNNTGPWKEGIRILPASDNYATLALLDSTANNALAFVYNPVSQYAAIELCYSGINRVINIPYKSGTFALTNDFKTINGQSIIGSGDINVGGGGGAYLPLSGGTMTAGNINWSTDSHGIYFYNNCGIEKWEGYGPALVAENGTTFEICDRTNRATRYTILHSGNWTNYVGIYNSNGNIGIGISTPSYKLDVSGKVRFGDAVTTPVEGLNKVPFVMASTTHYSYWYASFGNSTGSVLIGVNTDNSGRIGCSGGKNLTLAPDGGNIGVGTSPSYKLQVSGDIYATGGVTSLSDIRKKDVISYELPLSVEQIANAPTIKFLWKDKRDEGEQVGTIAQYWENVLPESIKDKSGELSMSYGVAALLSAITTARKVVDHEQRITELERENADLKQAYSFIKNAYEELKLKIA